MKKEKRSDILIEGINKGLKDSIIKLQRLINYNIVNKDIVVESLRKGASKKLVNESINWDELESNAADQAKSACAHMIPDALTECFNTIVSDIIEAVTSDNEPSAPGMLSSDDGSKYLNDIDDLKNSKDEIYTKVSSIVLPIFSDCLKNGMDKWLKRL